MPVCVRVRVENREREDTDIVCLSIVKPQQIPRIKPDAIEIIIKVQPGEILTK